MSNPNEKLSLLHAFLDRLKSLMQEAMETTGTPIQFVAITVVSDTPAMNTPSEPQDEHVMLSFAKAEAPR